MSGDLTVVSASHWDVCSPASTEAAVRPAGAKERSGGRLPLHPGQWWRSEAQLQGWLQVTHTHTDNILKEQITYRKTNLIPSYLPVFSDDHCPLFICQCPPSPLCCCFSVTRTTLCMRSCQGSSGGWSVWCSCWLNSKTVTCLEISSWSCCRWAVFIVTPDLDFRKLWLICMEAYCTHLNKT